jgi:hypothetical protein
MNRLRMILVLAASLSFAVAACGADDESAAQTAVAHVDNPGQTPMKDDPPPKKPVAHVDNPGQTPMKSHVDNPGQTPMKP